jgi:hypothetical protein
MTFSLLPRLGRRATPASGQANSGIKCCHSPSLKSLAGPAGTLRLIEAYVQLTSGFCRHVLPLDIGLIHGIASAFVAVGWLHLGCAACVCYSQVCGALTPHKASKIGPCGTWTVQRTIRRWHLLRNPSLHVATLLRYHIRYWVPTFLRSTT